MVRRVSDAPKTPSRRGSMPPTHRAAEAAPIARGEEPAMSLFGNPDQRAAKKAEEAERRRRLQELTATAKRGLVAYAETGAALESIKNEELWRLTAPAWESWCQQELSLSARRVDQLIEAAVICRTITAAGIKPPSSERAARELAGLTPDAAISVWQEATEAAGDKEPTAATVAKAARKRKPKKASRPSSRPASFPVPGATVRVVPRRRGFTSMVAALEHALEIARRREQEREAA
jgi:hypothetical protein